MRLSLPAIETAVIGGLFMSRAALLSASRRRPGERILGWWAGSQVPIG